MFGRFLEICWVLLCLVFVAVCRLLFGGEGERVEGCCGFVEGCLRFKRFLLVLASLFDVLDWLKVCCGDVWISVGS